MNHHGEGLTLTQAILLATLSAGTGALMGYLTADLLLYKLILDEVKGSLEDHEPDTLTEEEIDLYKKSEGKRVAYHSLVRAHGYVPSEEPIRIVPKGYLMTSEEQIEHITFYSEDQTYAFEDGTMLEDPNHDLIPNAHLHFGATLDEEDPDVIYILNESRGVVFEITRVAGSYKTDILGEPVEESKEEVKKPPKRSRRAAKQQPKDEKPSLKELADEIAEDDGDDKSGE